MGVYVQTVPKRGYRFIAPVDASEARRSAADPDEAPGTDLNLQKVLWSNIAELRLAEEARKERRRKAKAAILWGGLALAVAAVAVIGALLLAERAAATLPAISRWVTLANHILWFGAWSTPL